MKIYLYMLIVLFMSCQNKAHEKTTKSESSLIVLDLENIPKNQVLSKFELSEISSNLDIVPLEAMEESLISSINDVIITETDILIDDVKSGVIRFDRKGRFLNKIGKIGNGPEEYVMLNQIEFDENNSDVYLFTERGVKVYDLDGKFKRLVSNKRVSEFYDNRQGRGYLFNDYIIFNGKLPLRNNTNALWTFSVYDKSLNLIDSLFNSSIIENVEYVKNNRSPLYGWANYCSESLANIDFYGGDMKVQYYGNDTIFEIEKGDLSINPVYFLSMGMRPEFKISHEWIKSDLFFDYLWMEDFFESSNYLYFLLAKLNLLYMVRYTKASGSLGYVESKSNIIEKKMPGSPGWIYRYRDDLFAFDNDISGGDFTIRYRSKGRYLIDVIDPSNMLKNVDVAGLMNTSVKDENSKARLIDLLSRIKEDDNPILLIAKLK